MPISGLNTTEHETRDIRVRHSKERWARLDEWMRARGYTSLAEGIRAAINQVIDAEDSQQQNGKLQPAREAG